MSRGGQKEAFLVCSQLRWKMRDTFWHHAIYRTQIHHISFFLSLMLMSHQNNKFNYYVVVNLLLTWVSPALSKNGAGYIPVIR